MSDLLGEALARWSIGLENNDDEAVVLAAARSWHTLTNPPDELIERIVVVLDAWAVSNDWHTVARAVVDALTDTAKEEK